MQNIKIWMAFRIVEENSGSILSSEKLRCKIITFFVIRSEIDYTQYPQKFIKDLFLEHFYIVRFYIEGDHWGEKLYVQRVR